jgi:hypothetical protein
MTALTRRQTLVGAAATVTAAALPAAAAVSNDYVMTPAVAKLLADMGAPSASHGAACLRVVSAPSGGKIACMRCFGSE